MSLDENTNKFIDFGTVAFFDLDNFTKCMEKKNWSRYTPNPITSYLTEAILRYIRNYRALPIWGLNEKEGTEETILFLQYDKSSVYKLIKTLKNEILNLAERIEAPTTLSAGIAEGRSPRIKEIKSHSKSEFKKDPTIYLAYSALKKAKKKGGNCIVVY